MKVTIDAGGRQVTIETESDLNLTYREVADKALEVWLQTEGAAKGTAGPSFGVQAERGPDRTPTSTMYLPVGPPA
jgi:hypothetical protein